MSTTAAELDGFVVITEVCRKDNKEVSFKTCSKTDALLNFFKGEPLALGITQILCGFFQVSFGIFCDVNPVRQSRFKYALFHSGVPFWSGILYIISGSLSVAAAKNPRIALVRGSLIMNIISAVTSAVAIFLYTLHVTVLETRIFNQDHYCVIYDNPEICDLLRQAKTISYAIFCLMLILSILGFCISISTSVFGCKAVCRTAFSEVSMVIFQASSPQPSQPTISTVPPSLPDAHAVLPSFKEFDNPSSVSLIEKLELTDLLHSFT